MVELSAKTPCDGMLPLTIGTTMLTETDPSAMTSIAPYKGQDKALSDVLKRVHGMAVPAPNRTSGKAGMRALWFGQRVTLLMGPVPDTDLSEYAALTDQSDAWAVVRLEGDRAVDVLARLTPVDLRPMIFKRGHTMRTDLKHMMASITRIGERSYQIMVFRAFARTLVHDLQSAMEGVAARAPA